MTRPDVYIDIDLELPVKKLLEIHGKPHYCVRGYLWFHAEKPCPTYKLAKRLDDAELLLRSVAFDRSEECDHPVDCSCTMGQAIRFGAKYDNVSVEKFIER